MHKVHLYVQLTREFEQRLKRQLTEKEKSLIHWMAERQSDIDNEKTITKHSFL
ncbi:hypothetical protein HUG15_15785 [Salicibibacter cibarius]|uniref:Uncharacterized protein n=1 Tax=Salicibibacter cibarius TaxID=2743000 RepID=A0A7T6Z4Y0_9BACI|nr:hypothetical protein [Salicibibacter cibarius]QQK76882.1 hypothetical protein HUG15_15785 [Salicibibacter cibarius]